MAKAIVRTRSAITGKFVPSRQAITRPKITVTETIRIKGKK